MKVRFIMHVTIRKRFTLLQTIEGISFGLVRMFVTPYRIFWIIFTSGLAIRFTDKLLVFRWVQMGAPLVADLFFICNERDFHDFSF